MNNVLRNSIVTEEFDYNFLKSALSQYKNPRVKINDLLKRGEIIRVKKGLYIFGPGYAREPYSKETLANLIYGPSYISLDYALSFYGLIPERVETVSSVTCKRNKLFKTPVGIFSYKYLNPLLYSYGITLHKMDENHSILIATKEKALSDKLYFTHKMTGIDQIKTYLIEDLRIDLKSLKEFNLKITNKLARSYGNNIKLLYQLLEKNK